MEVHVCPICGKVFYGFGHNGAPVVNGCVCDDCNYDYVIPARAGLEEETLWRWMAGEVNQTVAEINGVFAEFMGEYDLSEEKEGGVKWHSFYGEEHQVIYAIDVTFRNASATIIFPPKNPSCWAFWKLLHEPGAILPTLLQGSKKELQKLAKRYKKNLTIKGLDACTKKVKHAA